MWEPPEKDSRLWLIQPPALGLFGAVMPPA
jgi:hypothetical protein